MAGKTTNFNDYIQAEFNKDLAFKAGVERESAKLDAAVALSAARRAAGLTQQALADRAKVPQSTVARIERGANTSIDTYGKLVNALGMKVVFEVTPL
ncbi:helix-turn-helix transcriptional regulator [Lacticaseibacillus paracasei]|uniref:helix-turn-helix domain-containing protein n=1 Tax=Lacticaseibacillus paracasei TaxID=1597 RepID=UPI003391E21B